MNKKQIRLCLLLLLFTFLMVFYNQRYMKMLWQRHSRSTCDVVLAESRQRAIIEKMMSENAIWEERNGEKKREKVVYLKTPKTVNHSFAETPCKTKQISWTMYTLVKSAAQNFRQRELLRRTWVSLKYVNGGRMETIFVIGVTSETNQNLLEEESSRYEDILQIEVDDAYRNIGEKTLAGMQWASENLPGDYFYSSADDDFLVDIGGVQEAIDENRHFVSERSWPVFPILCIYKSRINDSPLRDSHYKSYISFKDYIWPYFPDYCLGGMYTTSVKVAGMLWNASRTTSMVRMDDVWITGILRQKIGIPKQYIKTIPKQLAFHFTGFSNRNSLEAKDYVMVEWKKIYDTFKEKHICTRR